RVDASGEELARQAGVEGGLRHDDHDRLLADHAAKRCEALLGRLGDRDDEMPVLDSCRERLEALRVLARKLSERKRVEEDRRALDEVESPLMGEHPGDVVLTRELAPHDNLAE